MAYLLWPFRVLWGLVSAIVGLVGRLVSLVLGVLLLLVGLVLSITIVAFDIGLPIALFGAILIVRSFY